MDSTVYRSFLISGGKIRVKYRGVLTLGGNNRGITGVSSLHAVGIEGSTVVSSLHGVGVEGSTVVSSLHGIGIGVLLTTNESYFPACDCDPAGSLSPLCSESGQCPCRPGVGGPTCSDCLPNFFNFTSEGCTPCDCSEFSIASTYCNVTTGQCLCPEGVTGRTCNTCIPEFFNLTSEGCLPCDCNTAGNETGSCDETTGQCLCSGNLVGRQCNQCGDGFFNTSGENREVCTPCVCSGRSSTCSQSLQDSMTSVVHFNFSQLCPTNPTNCSDGWKLLTSEGRDITFGPK